MSRAVALLLIAAGAAPASDLRYPPPVGPYQNADWGASRAKPLAPGPERRNHDRVAHAELTYTVAPEPFPPAPYETNYQSSIDNPPGPWARQTTTASSYREPNPSLGIWARTRPEIDPRHDPSLWQSENRIAQRLFFEQPDLNLTSPGNDPPPTSEAYGYPSGPSRCCDSGRETSAITSQEYGSRKPAYRAAYPDPSRTTEDRHWRRAPGSTRTPLSYGPSPAYPYLSEPSPLNRYGSTSRLAVPEINSRHGLVAPWPTGDGDYSSYAGGLSNPERYAITWNYETTDPYLPSRRTADPRTDRTGRYTGNSGTAPREKFETVYWSPDWDPAYGGRTNRQNAPAEPFRSAGARQAFFPEYRESFLFRPAERRDHR